ncbi:hypothetical protein AB0C27_54015 [Nonomuraea sp. NPDC048882]|uniref:hypothetical protein n=1 Tax=Nonomuraea sp. NPDC048882 TaxID=3154347 RepID=UPI00340964F8
MSTLQPKAGGGMAVALREAAAVETSALSQIAAARAASYQALGDAATNAGGTLMKALVVAEEMLVLASRCHDDGLVDGVSAYRDTVALAARQAASLHADLAIAATRMRD